MATRKPVRVLPVPVGEATRTSSPAAMCGQAARWGSVGPWGKRLVNQLWTAGWKVSSGAATGIPLIPPACCDLSTGPPVGSGGLAAPTGDHRGLGQVEGARG